MKVKRTCKLVAALLVAAMLFALLPTAYAADEPPAVSFRKVEEGREAPRTELKVHEEQAGLSVRHADTDIVRVSILLEEQSTLDQGYSTTNVSGNADAICYRSRLLEQQETMAQRISRQALDAGETLDVVWNLTLTTNLISANVEYGKIADILAVPGVRDVVLETRYEPAVYSVDEASPNMATSAEMIGSSAAYGAGYYGAGMRIAVIDTGTDTDHRSFDSECFDYAIAEDEKSSGKSYDLLDVEKIETVLTQLNAYKRTLDHGRPTASTPEAEDLYFNSKLAFGYNYVDSNLNITHDLDQQSEHGSHVAGIATANRYVKTEDGYANALETVYVQGVAPDAQLITMKVFGEGGGAYESDYMAAIEDAIILNCDAINLSLGSNASGFASSDVYQEIMDRLAETDTVVTISAGNEGAWINGTRNGYLYAEDVNMNRVGSPGSYANALTVASADNVGYTGMYLTVADKNIFYGENLFSNQPFATFGGSELEYVLIDGAGNTQEWGGLDLSGKVAVCARGEISFAEKAQAADDAGAAALIVYNNEPGAILMDLTAYDGTIPCVSVTQSEGDWLRQSGQQYTYEYTYMETIYDEEEGWIDVERTQEAFYYAGILTASATVEINMGEGKDCNMSSFSSWGVPGNLTLKPEITAPGGYIYSVNGQIPGGEAYETMSGTSMAAPQVAGMAALVAQYIEESGLAEKTGLTPRVLAQSLLMSTAEPIVDGTSGMYYPVIQQGAGLANVGKAVSAQSYVLVDGQPDGKVKAELGDDPNRTGKYTFSFTLNNLSDQDQNYNLSAELLTQASFESYATPDDETWAEYELPYRTAWFMDTKTAPLSAGIVWQVDGTTLEQDAALHRMDFNGDDCVTVEDAQALLDYVAGVDETLYNAAYADLDEDGTVTTYDAYLFLELLNQGKVTIPANDSVHVTVTMTLTEAQKESLDEIYVNGAYVQGYVFAEPEVTQEGVVGVCHSIPLLAFYGNWSDASMYEPFNYHVYDCDPYDRFPYMGSYYINCIYYTVGESATLYKWGGNPVAYDTAYLPERAALNNQNGDTLQVYDISTIRNAAAGKLIVSNSETGEVYQEREIGSLYGGFYASAAGAWMQNNHYVNIVWDGTDASGTPLPENTTVDITTVLAPEYYVDSDTGSVDWDALGAGSRLTTTATIDNTAPELTGVAVDPINRTITVTAVDNQFVASVDIRNPDCGRGGGLTPNQMEAGVPVQMEIEADRLNDHVGTPTGAIRVTLYDYASNYSVYDVEIGTILGGKSIPREYGMFDTAFYTWMQFNNNVDPETMRGIYSMTHETAFSAAAAVDSWVFAVTDTGDLYVLPEGLNVHEVFVGNLGIKLYDMAYNTADQTLYGVTDAGNLVRIDKLTGQCTDLGQIGVATNTLACDDMGTFYCLDCTSETGDLYTFTTESFGEPALVGQTGNKMTDRQSLAWNPNDGALYWCWFVETIYQFEYEGQVYSWSERKENLCRVDPTTAHTEVWIPFFDSPIVALYIRDMDGMDSDGWDAEVETASGMFLQQDQLRLMTGENREMSAAVLPWTAANRDVVWTSTDPAVAVVDPQGVVTGVGAGTCMITATSALTPAVQASCQVTVEPMNVTLEGIVRDENGTSRLFTWEPHRTDTWESGPAVDLEAGAVAYDRAHQNYYVQGYDEGYAIRQIDPQTGEILDTSARPIVGTPMWDMTSCEFLTSQDDPDGCSIIGIYASYVGVPAGIMGNTQLLYGLDLMDYLVNYTGAYKLIGVASAGQHELLTLEEDGSGGQVQKQYDAERIYAMDNNGCIWALDYYETDNHELGVAISIFASDLINRLVCLDENDHQNCSLAYDFETDTLVLSYFTGEASEIYALRYDGKIFRSTLLGKTADGQWPMTLFSATFATDNEINTAARQLPAEIVGMEEATTIYTDAAGGSLNGSTEAGKTVTKQTSGAEPEIAVPVELSGQTNNGLVVVSYDPAALELQSVHSTAQYYSVNDKGQGQVLIAFADLNGLTSGEAPAVLHFTPKEEAPCTTTVSWAILQQNDRIGTAQEPVNTQTQVVTVRHDGEKSGELYVGDHMAEITYSCRICGEHYTELVPVDCPSDRFRDVDTAAWYHNAVDFAVYHNLMQGMSGTEFRPNGSLTRGQLVTILYRLAGSPKVTSKTPFTDVKENRYYADAVAWAYETGITQGMTETLFAPEANVTREQMVTFLYRYAMDSGADVTTTGSLEHFQDGSSVSQYAVTPMVWAVENQILQGLGNGKLAPQGSAVRAQFAAIVYRYCTGRN